MILTGWGRQDSDNEYNSTNDYQWIVTEEFEPAL